MLSRKDVLRGLPAKRASTLLFLIESRTAYLAARSRRDVDPFLADRERREEAYLEAFSLGARPVAPVTIQQIEQYAASWAPLAPDTAQARAALAQRLGTKYSFTSDSVPGIRRALALDDTAVQEAYQDLYGVPIATVFAPAIALSARPAWYWQRLSSRLEGLHPFWMAFALTLPAGPGLMALPIALAGVRPAVGVGLIALFALINIVTVGAMAESVARSGITRYGQGYLGQLVADWLGPAGSIFLTFAFAVDGVLILPVFYLGIATTLGAATGIRSPIWVAATFLIGLYFLSRRTLNTTVASTLVIVAINISILVAIPLLVLPHFSLAALGRATPPFRFASVQLVFGVLLSNFFAHQQVANYARVVLRRDPGARFWLRGSMVAIAATALISVMWLVAVDGSLAPRVLQQDAGTVIVPLGTYVNPFISILGSALVVLSLGMLTIHISLGLLFTTQERLPDRVRRDPRLGVILPIIPVAAIFLITEWLAISGAVSFASLLGFVTVLTLTTLGGFFPILLVIAGRRKSDVAIDGLAGSLGHAALLTAVYALFLSVIFVYALFIWSTALQRAVTLLAALSISVGTAMVIRRGMLARRLVVEIRDDENLRAEPSFAIVHAGSPLAANIMTDGHAGTRRETTASGPLPPISELRTVHFDLPAAEATEIKVWVHRVSTIGESDGIPSVATIQDGADQRVIELSISPGWAVLPIRTRVTSVTIDLSLSTAPATAGSSHAEWAAGTE